MRSSWVLTGALFALLLARRNWALGRTDRRGALRIAGVSLLLELVGWIGAVHAVPTGEMVGLLYYALASGLLYAALIWLVYLALEPAVRARWPHSIVTWNRVLVGRWMDAQVGSHVLIGAALGCSIWLAFKILAVCAAPKGSLVLSGGFYFMEGTRQWIAGHAHILNGALSLGLIGFFAICGLRAWLKSDLLAAVAASILFTFREGEVANAVYPYSAAHVLFTVVTYCAVYAALIFVLLRLGLVAMISAVFFINGLSALALGADWNAWWAPSGIATLALLLTLALAAFARSLGSQGLFGAEAAEASCENP